MAAGSAVLNVPTAEAADPYRDIVRSFNSINECEHYRETRYGGAGACLDYPGGATVLVDSSPGFTGGSRGF